MADEDHARSEPHWLAPENRWAVILIQAIHPALLASAELLEQCSLRTQRRSGPGGQHRNKTSSGVFLSMTDWNIEAEATERRSQSENRDIALLRLRYKLAVALRTPSIEDSSATGAELELRQAWRGSNLKIREGRADKPAVIALLLNDLWAAGGQPSLLVRHWECRTSSIVQLIATHPPALRLVNQIRLAQGRPPLHG